MPGLTEEDEDESDKDMIEIGMKGFIGGKKTKCASDANVAETQTCIFKRSSDKIYESNKVFRSTWYKYRTWYE
jgi:hypothetical protein